MLTRLRDAIGRLRSPRLWLAVAGLCVLIGVGRRSSRWSARRGYALRRAGRTDAAIDAFRDAVDGADAEPGHVAGLAGVLGDAGRWDEAAELYREARLAGETPEEWLLNEARAREKAEDWDGLAEMSSELAEHDPTGGWHRQLGMALERSGDTAGALAAYRTAAAVEAPRQAVLAALGQLERRAGDPAAAVDAYRRAAEIEGNASPQIRRTLARLFHAFARFDDAADALRANVAASDTDAASRVQLGNLLLERHRWGGTFTGSLRGAGTFVADTTPGDLDTARLEEASRAFDEAYAISEKAAWLARAAEVLEERGRFDEAIERYEQALEEAGDSFRVRLPWQFRLERSHHSKGEPRVDDPQFTCRIEGNGIPTDDIAAGVYRGRFDHGGLVIEGMVTDPDVASVEVLLDDTLLRSVNLGAKEGYRRFSLRLVRDVVTELPARGTFRVRTSVGTPLHAAGGAAALDCTVPHGDGSLPELLAGGRKLDKKGRLTPTAGEIDANHERYLELYAEVRDVMEERLGRKVFLMYGTLLGCIRDGDFIPGDDDFDAGYISDHTDPETVKRETLDIMKELLRAGFMISFNRRGRLFRAQHERDAGAGIHLDLRPIWFANGNIWVHNHASFPCEREAFVPVDTRMLRDTKVYVPARPEVFLEGHYGPGWRVPDPGFTYEGLEIDPRIKETLRRALITPAEYHEFRAEVDAEAARNPGMGRLVSIGSQDLYPLERLVL